MQLHTLQLINFKNYDTAKLEFSEKTNVFVGKNGCGKTNILDSIHYLSLTRSAFLSADNYAIRHGEKFFSIKGSFKSHRGEHDLLCTVQAGQKKVFRENGNDYQKISDHVGKYPVVLIAPDDTDLVKEGSESRRKFFDAMIAQLDKAYLESLIEYSNALKQRNSLLKMSAETGSFDSIVMESYDRILERAGANIFQRRNAFIAEYQPVFQKFYNYIVSDENVALRYSSELVNTSYQEGFAKSRQRDLFTQRTNFGVHKDEYHFTIDTGDLRRLGSQGQQKSFVIALKLAQFELITRYKKSKPLLLLDDIFDKLDDYRIEKLLSLIKGTELGQLFITDARPDRTVGLLQQIQVSASIFAVEKGIVAKQ
jgi:DNA replication and repair protein RecF